MQDKKITNLLLQKRDTDSVWLDITLDLISLVSLANVVFVASRYLTSVRGLQALWLSGKWPFFGMGVFDSTIGPAAKAVQIGRKWSNTIAVRRQVSEVTTIIGETTPLLLLEESSNSSEHEECASDHSTSSRESFQHETVVAELAAFKKQNHSLVLLLDSLFTTIASLLTIIGKMLTSALTFYMIAVENAVLSPIFFTVSLGIPVVAGMISLLQLVMLSLFKCCSGECDSKSGFEIGWNLLMAVVKIMFAVVAVVGFGIGLFAINSKGEQIEQVPQYAFDAVWSSVGAFSALAATTVISRGVSIANKCGLFSSSCCKRSVQDVGAEVSEETPLLS